MRPLVAIDPGALTGVAFWHDDYTLPSSHEYEPGDFYEAMHVLSRRQPSCVVICEAFVITQATVRKSFQPWSLEMIGVVKAACFIGGHELWTPLPKASEAKSMVSNEVLHKLGWWHRGGEGHANDALRHLARYGFINGLLDKRLLLDP